MSETLQLDGLLLLLMDQGYISQEQAREIQSSHAQNGKPIRTIVIDTQLMTEDDLLGIIANYQGSHVINLPATDIPAEVVRSVPASVARMYNVVPVSVGVNSIEMVAYDLISPQLMDELMFVLTRDVSFVFAREEDVR